MTLDQKRELINKFNFVPLIEPGVYVDATDTTHSYLLAKVL